MRMKWQHVAILVLISLFLGATFVPTSNLIQENYLTYLPNPNEIHLSAEGYQAIANEFWTNIENKTNVLVK